MVQDLIWIIGSYVLGAVGVHAAHWRMARQSSRAGNIHYILYSANSASHVEFAVRSLLLFHWLQGKPVIITIVDEGSTDDTLAISRTLSRRHGLHLRESGTDDDVVSLSSAVDTSCDGVSNPAMMNDLDTANMIRIRLGHPEDMRKLPLGCPP